MAKLKSDENIEVEIELTDFVFLTLAKMAHEKDITFNQLCNQILIDKLK